MKSRVARHSFTMLLSVSLAFGLLPNPISADTESGNQARSSIQASRAFGDRSHPSVLTNNRIIVKYKNGANPARIQAINGITQLKQLSRSHIEVVEVTPDKDTQSVIAQLKQDPNVLYAEPDIRIRPHTATNSKETQANSSVMASAPDIRRNGNLTEAASISSQAATELVASKAPAYPNDPKFQIQWSLNNVGQNLNDNENEFPVYGTPDVDINAPEAWEITQGTPDTIVAIIDTGVEINHPDLGKNAWHNPQDWPFNGIDEDNNGLIDDFWGWNFYGNNSSVYSEYDDDYYGTQIAGIIAAQSNNNTGIAGVAPNVKYLPLKVMGLDGGYLTDALLAIDYAERMGAKIANIGWTIQTYSQALKDAIDASTMLFVTNAGEGIVNLNKDNYPEYPASYDSDNIVSVAGIKEDGSFYGIYGITSVDISAPMGGIVTTIPTRDPGIAAQVDNGTYKVSFNELDVMGIGDPAENHQDAFDKALKYLAKPDGSASSILLVNDEETSGPYTYLLNYKSMLKNAGVSYDLYTVPIGEDGPSLEKLNGYDIVIWYSGGSFGETVDGSYTSVLREADQANLTDYLNNGGHLMLNGAGTVAKIEHSDFVTNMLHLDFVRYDFDRDMTEISQWNAADGQPNTIYDGQSYVISGIALLDFKSNDPLITKINLVVPMNDYRKFESPTATYLAAPHVSGVAALILSQDPSLNAKSVKERILLGSRHLESLKDGDSSAYKNNGRMVDAFRALTDDDLPGKPLKASQTDKLDDNDPNDIYFVHLNEGDRLKLKMTSSGTSFTLCLFNTSAKSIEDLDNLVGRTQVVDQLGTLEYQATETGYYFVGALKLGSNNGAYMLEMEREYSNPAGTYEDTGSEGTALVFDGSWTEKSDASYSGETIKEIDSVGSVKFAFTGSQIEWKALKDETMGIADVYVDGVKVASPSLYSKTPQAQQSVFKQSLPKAYHTIQVAWTGKSDPAAKRTIHAINIDSFVVEDSGDTYSSVKQESDNAFYYGGIWAGQEDTHYSGGYGQVTDQAGAFAEFSFSGTGIALLTATTPMSGKVKVIIDNQFEKAKTIDLYSPSVQYQVSVFDSGTLSNGPHYLRVENVHEKNEKSGGFYTNIDAVVVTAKEEILKIYQDTNPFVKFTGVWTLHLSNKNSGSSAEYSDTIGNSVLLSFAGKKVKLLSQTGPNRGKVDIYIDNDLVTPESVDMYSEQFRYKVPVFESKELAYGNHIVKVINQGMKNDLSSGNVISFDAFYVTK